MKVLGRIGFVGIAHQSESCVINCNEEVGNMMKIIQKCKKTK
jgi:hypothetical protein